MTVSGRAPLCVLMLACQTTVGCASTHGPDKAAWSRETLQGSSMLQLKRFSKTVHDFVHPPWLQSCSAIYLDVGSNNGVQIRKLFEPGHYPNALVLKLFEKHFGNASTRCQPSTVNGLCALGMEPNPLHYDRLQRLEKVYTERGWNVHFYKVAAAYAEGMAKFTGMGYTSKVHPDYGVYASNDVSSHLSDGSKDPRCGSSCPEDVDVRAVDFAAFVKSLPAGKVRLMKMDIEGAEFDVLAGMAEQGVLCGDVVTEAFVEVHELHQLKEHWPTDFVTTSDGMNLFVKTRPCSNGVMNLTFLDDESYVDDDDNFDRAACGS